LGCIQAPRTSTQAETATNNGNGSMTTVKCGATQSPEEPKKGRLKFLYFGDTSSVKRPLKLIT
jgi:hypothetical protein